MNPAGPMAVAFSAGADSTALLLAAQRRWPGQVIALHVNHGLQAAADEFQDQAQAICALHAIALRVERVQAAPAQGESPEDAARQARYSALARMADEVGAACVLLGQHADDQAETVLLGLSRGAGLPGLAAMARCLAGLCSMCRPRPCEPGWRARATLLWTTPATPTSATRATASVRC
jgi:tRNA(Ile)-lysidine synthase